ncbi:MAG TPA: BON domain-containing protein, partial [Rhodanobacter sp.]|nr:BON domain-containing protein [Rhodanobacter sp.]
MQRIENMLLTSPSQTMSPAESAWRPPTTHSRGNCCHGRTDTGHHGATLSPRQLSSPKEIAMHNHSLIRRSMIAAGITLAFAAAPLSQAVASQSSEPAQTTSDNQTVPDRAADAWITTKVKTEFGTTKGVSATDIKVSTLDGVVTLTGTVGNEAGKMHAVRV